MSDTVTVNRKKYIGGSDLPNILGLNEVKYNQSILMFAKEKMKLIPSTFEGNPYTKYGQLIEPIVREYINAQNGVNYREESIVDEERGLRGNTDGIDRETDFIPTLEVKSFGESKELDVEYYEAQCQFYMEVFDQPAMALVGYKRPDDFYSGIDYKLENGDEFFNMDFDPERLVIHTIERDPAKWAIIYERILSFQTACVSLLANPNMDVDQWNKVFYDKALVKQQHAVIKLEKKMIKFKKTEDEHKEAKAKLIVQFEKYGVKTLDTGTIKITHVKTDASKKLVLDEKALAEKHPEITKEFTTKVKKTKGKSYMLVTVKKIGSIE
jgi:predicted phage-related endonuclease